MNERLAPALILSGKREVSHETGQPSGSAGQELTEIFFHSTYSLAECTTAGGVLKLNRSFVLQPDVTLEITLDVNVEKSALEKRA